MITNPLAAEHPSSGLADSPSPVMVLGQSAKGPAATMTLEPHLSRRRHSHSAGRDWLRDVILGGQDGLVNILGIILGVVAGGGGRTVLLSAGFAAAITESISMGGVGYTSTLEDRDYYAAQQTIEQKAVVDDEELEREEIRTLYRAKGFA